MRKRLWTVRLSMRQTGRIECDSRPGYAGHSECGAREVGGAVIGPFSQRAEPPRQVLTVREVDSTAVAPRPRMNPAELAQVRAVRRQVLRQQQKGR